MAIFFRPSDITTVTCTVNNKTKGGSAFAVCEDGQQVFISPKIVDVVRADVGDLLTAYCIDNHRDDNEGEHRFAVRWRAIRVTVKERFTPAVEEAPVAPLAAPVVPVTPVAPVEDLSVRITNLMKQNRAWTVAQLAAALGGDSAKVGSWVKYHHSLGGLVCAKLYTSGDQKTASHVYYAKDMALMRELIDEVTLE